VVLLGDRQHRSLNYLLKIKIKYYGLLQNYIRGNNRRTKASSITGIITYDEPTD
jgi:hypothetical protein